MPRRLHMILRLLPGLLLVALATCPLRAGAQPAAIRLIRQAHASEAAGRHSEALDLYRQAWAIDSRRSDVAIRGSRILRNMGRHEESVEWLRQAADFSPHEALVWVEYGDAYEVAGDSVMADSVWRRGGELAAPPDLFYRLRRHALAGTRQASARPNVGRAWPRPCA